MIVQPAAAATAPVTVMRAWPISERAESMGIAARRYGPRWFTLGCESYTRVRRHTVRYDQ